MGITELAAQWWMFPMKPVQVDMRTASGLSPDRYVMERKYDGWRAILIANGKTRLWTRQRRLIEVPESLQEALEALRLPRGTVLDGEIWNPSKRGGWKDPEGEGCHLTLWDCVRDGTKDVGRRPFEERRKVLEDMVGNSCGPIGLTEQTPVSAEALALIHAEAKASRVDGELRSGFIHGVVLKRRGSPRHDHPTRSVEHADWLKVVFEGMKGWEPR